MRIRKKFSVESLRYTLVSEGFSGLDGQPEKIDTTNRLIRDNHVCSEIFVILSNTQRMYG